MQIEPSLFPSFFAIVGMRATLLAAGVSSAYGSGVLYVRFHVEYQYFEARTMVTTATVLWAAEDLHSASLDV
jgi:hypothetical protein